MRKMPLTLQQAIVIYGWDDILEQMSEDTKDEFRKIRFQARKPVFIR